VDYALLLEDKPVVLVEAKPFSSIMSQNESRQVISYGKVEDVQWAVLTNGKYLKVFDTEQGKSQKECLVTEIDLRDLPEKAKYVSLLSRESILAGEIEEAAARLADTRKAIDELRDRREEIAEKFKGDLLQITGSEVENRVASISSQLADQAIQLFEKSTEPPRSQEVQEVRLVRREDLADKPPGDVVVCISRAGGIEFVKKYSAWGYATWLEKTSAILRCTLERRNLQCCISRRSNPLRHRWSRKMSWVGSRKRMRKVSRVSSGLFISSPGAWLSSKIRYPWRTEEQLLGDCGILLWTKSLKVRK
jgi:hypothetical protein